MGTHLLNYIISTGKIHYCAQVIDAVDFVFKVGVYF